MNTNFIRHVLVLVLLALASSAALADTIPITGTPPLSSIAGGPFDSIDLANLNVHFSIPVFSRPGIGMPFHYNLSYDGLIWVPDDSTGHLKWTPVSNWGWRDISEASVGYISYQKSMPSCGPGEGNEIVYSDFTYHDAAGGVHQYSGTIIDNGCVGDQDFGAPELASDDSGYTLTSLDGQLNMTVTSRSGIVYAPPVGASQGNGTVTDPNNNQFRVTVSGSTTTIKDTLGSTALTVTGNPPVYQVQGTCSPTGNPTVNYQYTSPSGATAIVKVSYAHYIVRTNYGISTIADFGSPGNGIDECLVDKVTLPDNTVSTPSYYQFTYEHTFNYSGSVTGRLASVRLPTGGTITYSYDSTPGGTHNTMMSDGSPSFMYRTLSGGTWQYQRSVRGSGTTTRVIDPANNYDDMYFSGIYQTARSIYQGPGTTYLDYTETCYNGAPLPCANATVGGPITKTDIYHQPGHGSVSSKIHSEYDQYANLTSEVDYDFPAGATKIRTITNSYNGCTAQHICDELASTKILDSGGAQESYTAYAYDQNGSQHGKVTQVSSWTTGTNYLYQFYTYNTNGTLNTATDPKGTMAQYTYGAGSCGTSNNAFPIKMTVNGLITQYSYNCGGGVVTQVVDPNNAATKVYYTQDPFYWRPEKTVDAGGNTTYYNYYNVHNPLVDTHAFYPGQIESVLSWTGSTADNLITPDSYGRTWLRQTWESPSSGNWDTTQYFYNSSGQVANIAYPFATAGGPGGASPGHIPAMAYLYDGMGRLITAVECNGVDCKGSSTSYTYILNDIKIVYGAGSGLDPTFSKQLEYDALGRVTSVCEISSRLLGVGSCGQGGPIGYLTTYSYDALGDLTYVSQGQGTQTRSFSYDGLGRMTLESNPESEAKSYTFDSVQAGYCAHTVGTYTSTGDLVATADANGAHVYYYDPLHRLTAVGNSQQSAANPCHRFRYDDPNNGYKGPPPAGISPANAKGRLVEAATDNCGDLRTQSIANGRMVQLHRARGKNRCLAVLAQFRRLVSRAGNLFSERSHAATARLHRYRNKHSVQ